jgi:hypothetical protein
MLYIILRGHWCIVIDLNVRAPDKNKSDTIKNSLYEKLECVFNQLSACHMEISLEDTSTKVGREYSFKPTVENETSD